LSLLRERPGSPNLASALLAMKPVMANMTEERPAAHQALMCCVLFRC
jgi:hypothetical protein